MRVTLRDIARELQLSHATISFVLNDRRDVSIPEATRERVKEAAKRLGYRPNRAARALARGESDLVAYWAPRGRPAELDGLESELISLAESKGMEVVTRHPDFESPSAAAADLEDWPIGFTVLLDCGQAPWIGLTQGLDHPAVSIGASVDHHIDCVEFDLEQGALLAFQHLKSKGADSALHFSLTDPSDPSDSKLGLMKEAADRAGVKLRQRQCVDSTPAGIRSAVRHEAESSGIPKAVIADSDLAAQAVMRSLHELGIRVPEDCLVMGFWGSSFGETTVPSLTTVAFSESEAIQKAWRLLESRRVDARREPILETVSPRLVVRESTSKT